MGSKEYVPLRVDADLLDRIDDYGERNGLDRSKAARKLMDIGYQEVHHPALYRLKDVGVYGAFVMFMLALAVLPFGYLTSLLTATQTGLLAATLALFGAGWLAAVELARQVTGWV